MINGSALRTIRRLTLALVAAGWALACPALAEQPGERRAAQRAAFVAVWDDVVDGQWRFTTAQKSLLRDYPLWPDLVAARYSWYVAADQFGTAPLDAIRTFIRDNPSLKPAQRLRYRFVSALARERRWAEFSEWFEAHYAGGKDAALHCQALAAALDNRLRWSDARIASRARALWRVGRSQHDACDSPFNTLRARGVITRDDVRARMQLALDARRWSLAAYLAGMLDTAAQQAVRRWRLAASNPERLLAQPLASDAPALLAYATRRVALRDPIAAKSAWQRVGRRVDDTTRAQTNRFIALAGAQDRINDAGQWLRELPAEQRDARVLDWTARAAIAKGDWPGVLRAIGRMPMASAAIDRWRYWEGLALVRSGQIDAGRGLLEALAEERSFHGFMAADYLDLPYQFRPDDATIDTQQLTQIAALPAVQRVAELLAVGQPARANAEWRAFVYANPDLDDWTLAHLTHGWGWHVETFAALARAQRFDALTLRFPLAHDAAVSGAANRYTISADWIRGIARTESGFDPRAVSSAGAHGLMQLMPATAQRQARANGARWAGNASLFEPAVNIDLGASHLAALQARFAHPAVATAAYNAGANRAQRWLDDASSLPIDAWIETIPYDETRRYVERVLFAEIVYAWRRGATVVRLQQTLAPKLTSLNSQGDIYSGVLGQDSGS
ncbi:MAG: transglycosylase SLT domain-containing protein [Pseudomonadota bacterium]